MTNAENGSKTFLYVYYGGAGAHDGGPCQVIITDSATSKHVAYPLEQRIEPLARMDDMTCVFMLFDCSRLPLSKGLTSGQSDDAENKEF